MNSTVITPDIFQAVADPNRRTLLDLLLDGPRPVQELGAHFEISLAAVSQHLKVLLEAGLVSREARGKYRFYRAEPAALQQVHDWTEQYRTFWEDRLDRLGDFLDDQNPPEPETKI
jgi:DNA-binding transcriptional ArsR family regulator